MTPPPPLPLRRHSFSAIAASPDACASYIAAARHSSAAVAIDLFCRHSLQLKRTLGESEVGHEKRVVSLAFATADVICSSSGRIEPHSCLCRGASTVLLASSCSGGRVCIWDADAGALLAREELSGSKVGGRASVSWVRSAGRLLLVVGRGGGGLWVADLQGVDSADGSLGSGGNHSLPFVLKLHAVLQPRPGRTCPMVFLVPGSGSARSCAPLLAIECVAKSGMMHANVLRGTMNGGMLDWSLALGGVLGLIPRNRSFVCPCM
jgi:hypothetical protein